MLGLEPVREIDGALILATAVHHQEVVADEQLLDRKSVV